MVAPLRRRYGRESSQIRKIFLAVNMKICGRLNVRKHKDIKGSYKYVTLDISLKFYKLDKMKITYWESKGKLEDLSKIIREFDKFDKLPYEKKRPKHESTDSYFYLAIYISRFMMISDTLDWHDCGSYTEMTAPSSNVYSTNEDESKRIIVHETLSHNFFCKRGQIKKIIVNKNV